MIGIAVSARCQTNVSQVALRLRRSQEDILARKKLRAEVIKLKEKTANLNFEESGLDGVVRSSR
jgi:hypothetical protein